MSIDLKYSLFLRSDDRTVAVKNTDISAVLLVAIGADRSYVCGAPSIAIAPFQLGDVLGNSFRVLEGLAHGAE